MNQPYLLYLCEPRGFCAGVERAIQIVELALKKFPPPIYVRHEIVHNRYVVEDLRGLNPDWLRNKHNIAITAGASAPEKLVQELITALQNIHPYEVVPLTYKQENVVFKLPKMLAG